MFLGAAKYTRLESKCCHMKWQQTITTSSGLAQAGSVQAADRNVGALAREGFQEEMTLNKISRLQLSQTCCFLGTRQCDVLCEIKGTVPL